MQDGTAPIVVATQLTPEEHDCAEILAYFNALNRGGRKLPPYEHAAAVRDFCMAADQIIDIRKRYPSTSVSVTGTYEQDPLDDASTRQVPIALRRYPHLKISGPAIFCFEKIKDSKSLSDDDYWTLLGHIWTRASKDKKNFNPRFSELYGELFASQRAGRVKLMTPSENATLQSLSCPLTIYRGCRANVNEDGLSWSRLESVATNFALTWNDGDYLLLEGTCDPSDVIAYFDFSSEQEVIIRPEKVKKINRKALTG